jgi:hypothetical protein
MPFLHALPQWPLKECLANRRVTARTSGEDAHSCSGKGAWGRNAVDGDGDLMTLSHLQHICRVHLPIHAEGYKQMSLKKG